MVSQTSRDAYQPKSTTRQDQKSVIFAALWQYSTMGLGATCEQLAEMTKIKPSTVYGRLGDLREGYVHEGTRYYCVVSGVAKGEHCNVQTYGLTVEKPEPTLEDIEKVKKNALKELRKWRKMYNAYVDKSVKGLFDQ